MSALKSTSDRYERTNKRKESDKARVDKIDKHDTKVRNEQKEYSQDQRLKKKIDTIMTSYSKGKLENGEQGNLVTELDDAMDEARSKAYRSEKGKKK